MHRWILAAGLAGALLSPLAQADEKEADTCIRNKVWDGYSEGWAVRTSTSATLGEGEHRVYLVTFYAGNEYLLRVCGDGSAENVDLIVYNAAGEELTRDTSQDREPSLTFKPSTTETYYVVVYASDVQEGKKSGIAMAVTYR